MIQRTLRAQRKANTTNSFIHGVSPMKTATSVVHSQFLTKRTYLLSALTAGVLAISGLAQAQTTVAKSETTLTRGQVKIERDEFLKTHRYDSATENWVLKSGIEPPPGIKSRAEIKAQRDEFLRNNRYDTATEAWVPVKGDATKTSTKSRRDVKEETLHFVRTHHWDDVTETWVENPLRGKKK